MIVQLKCLRSGLATQVQDLGRPGYQHLGIPIGGAMDQFAASTANALVGNSPSDPVLEITMWGPRIQISGPCQIAITGAAMAAMFNEQPLKSWHTIKLNAAGELSFGPPASGCRAYLAVGGEWNVRRWLGSCSAAVVYPDKLTPHSAFQQNASINIETSEPIAERSLTPPAFTDAPIRILPGPEHEQFPAIAAALLQQTFTVSPDSNRIGYRLSAQTPPPTDSDSNMGTMISSAVVPGTIQYTPSGQFVLLMRDAQTTGGYPRIANVITADLDRLAQAKPGDQISFTSVTQSEAVQSIFRHSRAGGNPDDVR